MSTRDPLDVRLEKLEKALHSISLGPTEGRFWPGVGAGLEGDLDRDTPSPKTFTVFRLLIPVGTHTEAQMNAPNVPQFEGVVFGDGTCVIRWMTAARSTSIFRNLDEMLLIHGHPEYGPTIVWHK